MPRGPGDYGVFASQFSAYRLPLSLGAGFCAGLERAGFRVSRLEWAWNIFVTKVYRYEHGGEFPRGMSGSRISGFDWEKGLILGPIPGMSPLLAGFLESEGLSCVPGSGWPTRFF